MRHGRAFVGAHPAALAAIAVAVGVLLVLTAPNGPADRLHALPGLPRLDDQQRARQPAPPAVAARGAGDLAGERLPALGQRRERARARLLPRRAWSPPRRWRSACRAGSGATAPRCPRRWPRRSSIYLGALAFGTVYTSAKALAIAAPLITLISLGGLLGASARSARRGSPAHRLRGLALLALAAGIALSSFLVLRQAPVAPQDHADQLAELRPLVQGHKVLFLGRDNFIAYELRGSRPFTAVRNYYDPNYVKPNLRLEGRVPEVRLRLGHRRRRSRRFPFVITTRAAYASGPPPAFEPLRETPDFVLWKRRPGGRAAHARRGRPSPGARSIARRRPGAARAARRHATVFAAPPVDRRRLVAELHGRERLARRSQALDPAAGRWEISIQYDATRPAARHRSGARRDAARRTSTTAARCRTTPSGELAVAPPRPDPVHGQRRAPAAGWAACWARSRWPISARSRPARPGAGGPIPGEAERRVPLSHGCGRYVDWYRPPRRALNRI